MATNLQTIITGNQDLNRVQSNIGSSLNSVNNSIASSPFIGGVQLTSVNVGTSATSINHSFGRTPKIWVITDQNTNTSVWRTAWSDTTITLQAGTACVISLYLG